MNPTLLVSFLLTGTSLASAYSLPSGATMMQRTAGRALAVSRGMLPSVAFSSTQRPRRAPFCLKMSGGSVAPSGIKTVYVKEWLEGEVTNALVRAFGDDVRDAAPMVTAATKPEFGDYQCNAAMPLAKSLKGKPRDIAVKLSEELKNSLGDTFEEPEIAGPGFLNLRFKSKYVSDRIAAMASDEDRLGIPKASKPDRVIVDFSSPNIAKEMHVGHLRSTIIGDTLCRLEEFLGHDVLRLNHVGDWGTQFGMLITFLKEKGFGPDSGLADLAVSDLVELYRQAKKRFDDDEEFQDQSRREVVALQGGDPMTLAAWKLLCDASRVEFQQIYDMLDINVEERGESFYNPMLADVIEDLKGCGLYEKSEGAGVVYVDGYTNKEGERMPLLVQKTDGGFMYATTDLAAIRHRATVEKADRVLYVTDAGQSQHFDQVFKVAHAAKWIPDHASFEHVPFGLVQGEDGKKFKTRSGDTVKLRDLLDESIKIATADMKERFAADGKDFGKEQEDTARIVGLAAVKYADLSMNRESNYRFSYKKMLSLSGNTAPYMLYAYARISGISRKMGDEVDATVADIILDHPSEIALARHLLMLPETLQEVEQALYPHRLCDYLFELSQKFNQFYENCPVSQAETPELVRSRVSLCTVTARAIRLSLEILGIKTVDRL